jgi:hypothetical protein
MMKTVTTLLVGALAAAGCSKKTTDANAEPGKATEGGGASALPALTADPEPAPITAADKPPFESVSFRMAAKRNAKGWPKYTAYNHGTKVVTAIAIYAYAYDAGGKQVARTQTPMSWNGNLKPAGKTDWEIEVGMSGPDVPATAVAYDVCFDSIKFEGDAKWTEDTSRCPDQKPKAK